MPAPLMPYKDVEVRGHARMWKLYRARSGAVGLNIYHEAHEWRYPGDEEWQPFVDEQTGEVRAYGQWANPYIILTNGDIYADNVRMLKALYGWEWQNGVKTGTFDCMVSWISLYDEYWERPTATWIGQYDRPVARNGIVPKVFASDDESSQIGAEFGHTLRNIAAEIDSRPTNAADVLGSSEQVPY